MGLMPDPAGDVGLILACELDVRTRREQTFLAE